MGDSLGFYSFIILWPTIEKLLKMLKLVIPKNLQLDCAIYFNSLISFYSKEWYMVHLSAATWLASEELNY